ncbi:Franean1_4349 family RiPP [Candidatus Dojkabacteria bacterium]|nr:Franean1_4349 family RiPP [Candidatus Dojkabacteria bacterium]
MSLSTVQAVIGRAATDAEFRKILMENAEEALVEYTDLTPEEKETLIKLDSEKLNAFSLSLDERITKGFSRFS